MMIRYLAGPLIGSVIGYFTNYIAVKMLFFPRREIKVWGHTLPFTPGAIPKGKARLAKAIGKAVDEQLLTSEDIRNRMEDPETVDMVTKQVMALADMPLEDLAKKVSGSDDAYDYMMDQLTERITDQIMDSVGRVGIGEIIATEGSRIIKERTEGTMLSMFVSDSLIASLTEPVSEYIETYIAENGRAYIDRELMEKSVVMSVQSISGLLEDGGVDRARQEAGIKSAYTEAVGSAMEKMLSKLNIAQMVEEKINAMDILELENLVLAVMKKELSMIVNLGALIGFVLGLVNLVI